MRTSAIAVSGLRKAYGDQTVLDGIDLDVPAGTVFALLGPNGAGKTTTVHILSTLLRPDAGRVTAAGLDLARAPGRVRGGGPGPAPRPRRRARRDRPDRPVRRRRRPADRG